MAGLLTTRLMALTTKRHSRCDDLLRIAQLVGGLFSLSFSTHMYYYDDNENLCVRL
jgi:hypothetical protein